MKLVKLCKCRHCGKETSLTVSQRIFSPHLFHRKYWHKCAHCGRRSWLEWTRGDVNNEQ